MIVKENTLTTKTFISRKPLFNYRQSGIFILLMILIWFQSEAQQIFSNRETEVVITKTALDHIYNFQFEKANENIQQLEKLLGSHAGLDLIKAIHVYWEHLPLQPGTEAYKNYEDHLIKSARQADDLLKKNKKDIEGIFFSMAAYGYLAALYADEGNIMKAIGNARKAYGALSKGFDLKDELAEFYFSTGLYNYYREKYPERHPGYKPFVWVFEKGDKATGIAQLKTASENSLFTRVEAFYYLFHILMRHENNPAEAIKYSGKLMTLYPDNLLYNAYHIEALIFNGQFDQAEPVIGRLLATDRQFYTIPGKLFQGMILEKKHRKLEEAKKLYEHMLTETESVLFDIDYYKSLALAGLARIAHEKGDQNLAKENYQKALKLGSYDIVNVEAKEYIKKN